MIRVTWVPAPNIALYIAQPYYAAYENISPAASVSSHPGGAQRRPRDVTKSRHRMTAEMEYFTPLCAARDFGLCSSTIDYAKNLEHSSHPTQSAAQVRKHKRQSTLTSGMYGALVSLYTYTYVSRVGAVQLQTM